jgi:hypothetical protein
MENESRPGSRRGRKGGSPWSGVLLIIVGSAVVGLSPAGALIGLAVVGLILDRMAPRGLDQITDLLTF